MAEFENNHCTGCGYHKRWGHRPFCWRKINQAAGVYLGSKNIRKCLKEAAKHHRFLSLFLSKKRHVYYTVASIDNGVKERAINEGREGYYRCGHCGFSELEENEIHCWECGKGEMLWQEL